LLRRLIFYDFWLLDRLPERLLKLLFEEHHGLDDDLLDELAVLVRLLLQVAQTDAPQLLELGWLHTLHQKYRHFLSCPPKDELEEVRYLPGVIGTAFHEESCLEGGDPIDAILEGLEEGLPILICHRKHQIV